MAESLYKNKSSLEAIFRILDKDNSGQISLEEFGEACELLRSHFPHNTHEQLLDMCRMMDINKDGLVDLNEFLETFRLCENAKEQLLMSLEERAMTESSGGGEGGAGKPGSGAKSSSDAPSTHATTTSTAGSDDQRVKSNDMATGDGVGDTAIRRRSKKRSSSKRANDGSAPEAPEEDSDDYEDYETNEDNGELTEGSTTKEPRAANAANGTVPNAAPSTATSPSAINGGVADGHKSATAKA